MPGATRRIRLKRNILVKGEHTEKGTVLDAPIPLAHSLVGDGSAEYHEDSADEVAAENAAGLKVHETHVQSGDPQIRKVADAPKKPAAKSGS